MTLTRETLLVQAEVYGLDLDEQDVEWLLADLPWLLGGLAALGQRDLGDAEPTTILRVP